MPVGGAFGAALLGADTRLGVEAPGQGPLAAAGVRGEVGERQRTIEVVQSPGACGAKARFSGRGDGPGDELGLAALAVGGEHVPSRDFGRDRRAVVDAHNVQREVRGGGHAG